MTVVDARGIPRALFTGVTGLRARLEEWDAGIRGPVGAVRRIGFLQLEAGVGATTLARETSHVVASRRSGAVLTVDATATGDLARQLRVGVTQPDETRAFARTSSDALAGIAAAPDGRPVLHPAKGAVDGIGAWLDEVAPIARFFDATVTDFGPRHPAVDMASAAALCDVVCLVSPADRGPAELSRSLAAAVGALPEHPRVVLALVDLARTARRAPQAVAGHSPHPVVRVPFDAGLAGGEGARSLTGRLALLELSAALMAGAATGSALPAPGAGA